MTDYSKNPRELDDPHPVGTTIGATTGVAAGAAVGTAVGGPVGGILGAVIGGFAGGATGHEIAEALDPTHEDDYWRENFARRPYVDGDDYDVYRPAYFYGWNARRRTLGSSWDELESDLRAGWEKFEDKTELTWERAKDAIRDGWERVERGFDRVFDDEDEYWRTNYRTRPYVDDGASYDTYRPAYEYGWSERVRRFDHDWDDVEDELERGWEKFERKTKLTWERAKDAVRDAWHHVEEALPGDFDRDGR